MVDFSLATLVVKVKKSAFFARFLQIAEALELPVTTWQTGDPARSLGLLAAEWFEAADVIVANFIAGGFLDLADENWVELLAEQVFGVARVQATYVTTTLVLTNTQGGEYTLDPGEVVAKCSATGKTYTSTSGGYLASGPGTTLTIDLVADEAGADSSVGVGDIDELVTNYEGVTVTNPFAAFATNKEAKATLILRCRAKLAALSPNGPADAHVYVALTPELSGAANVTKARVLAPPGDGTLTLVIASDSGPVTEDDRLAVEAAILELACPDVETPIVVSASAYSASVVYQLFLYSTVNLTEAEIVEQADAALDAAIVATPIGGDEGSLRVSKLVAALLGAFPGHAYRAIVTSPPADALLSTVQVAVAAAHTATITVVDS